MSEIRKYPGGLRQRILAVKAGVVIVSLLILALITRLVVMPGFERIEQREVSQNWKRISQTVVAQGDILLTHEFDWAEWDDAYNFVENSNQEFIDSNLPPDLLPNMKLTSMSFLRLDGSEVYERIRKDADFKPHIGQQMFKLLGEVEGEAVKGGLIKYEGRNMYFALRPISRTAGIGEPNGWMIWTRELDEAFLNDLRNQLHLSFELKDVASVSPTGGLRFKTDDSSQQIVAIGGINDYAGRPTWELTLTEKRESTRKHSILYF